MADVVDYRSDSDNPSAGEGQFEDGVPDRYPHKRQQNATKLKLIYRTDTHTHILSIYIYIHMYACVDTCKHMYRYTDMYIYIHIICACMCI